MVSDLGSENGELREREDLCEDEGVTVMAQSEQYLVDV